MVSPALYTPPLPRADDDGRVVTLRQTLDSRIREIAAVAGRKVMMSSLAVEDMVITEALARLAPEVEWLTIDTGMLPPETTDLHERVLARFGRRIAVIRPQAVAIGNFVAAHGELAMYESVDLRRTCCFVRKVEPLQRALQGVVLWITGQRRAQALTRQTLEFVEKDIERGIQKFNPVFDFDEQDVWALVRALDLPVNPLYLRGYPSIGCAPCSKPVRKGEDIRAGRWWWEQADKKECGLHLNIKENQ